MPRSRLRIAIVALHGVVAAHDHLAQGLAVGGDVAHLVVDDADIVGDEVADSLRAFTRARSSAGSRFHRGCHSQTV